MADPLNSDQRTGGVYGDRWRDRRVNQVAFADVALQMRGAV